MSQHGQNSGDPTVGHTDAAHGKATTPVNETIAKQLANNPVSAGTGKHRGDQRDRNPHYTGTENHSARGNTPRVNTETRKD